MPEKEYFRNTPEKIIKINQPNVSIHSDINSKSTTSNHKINNQVSKVNTHHSNTKSSTS